MQKLTLTVFTQADDITKAVKPVPGASVAIYRSGTNTLAAVFQDDESTGKTNPMIADDRGFIQCKLQNGAYDILISYGNQQETIRGWVGYDGAISAITLTMPAQFTVTGGTNVGWAPAGANKVLAGPTSGDDAAPVFRSLIPADLPAATTSANGTVKLATAGQVRGRTSGVVVTADQLGLVYLGKVTASNSPFLEIKNGTGGIILDGTYGKYVIEAVDIVPATNGANLLVSASIDTGTNYLTGTNYWSLMSNVFGGTFQNTAAPSAQLNVYGIRSGNSGDGYSGTIEFLSLSSASNFKRCMVRSVYPNTADGVQIPNVGSFGFKTTFPVDALKFSMSAGNIASGDLYVYGQRAS